MVIETLGGVQRELRAFSLGDMASFGFRDLRSAGTGQVARAQVEGIPALARGFRLKAEAIASMKLEAVTGKGEVTEPASGWQSAFFQRKPNPVQTRFGFWETVGGSLGWRNNAYIWKNVDPASNRLVEWWALHPDQVKFIGGDVWEVRVAPGYVDPVGKGAGVYRVDSSTLMHCRGFGDGGQVGPAPDPVSVFRDALAIPVARQSREAAMWNKGTNVQLAIEFPENRSPQYVSQFRDLWRETYEGARGETTAIIGGGAQIKTIGMTMEQAQWLDSANLTISDAARITGVPAKFLGGGGDETLEQALDEWLRFGLGPDLERLESHLDGDLHLYPSGTAKVRSKFSTNGFVRGDLMTQAQIEHLRINDGSLLVDEARASRGLDPLPDGVGQIPQIVPVGGSPHGVPLPADPAASQTE